MKVIIDCNIWISFLLGRQTFLMRKILTNPMLDIFVCHELLTEIKDVACREKIRKYIDISDIDTRVRVKKVLVKVGNLACFL